MKKPEFPANEQERLQALQSLGILDTESEERFDRLTRMARRMFRVPIALVSLVDTERQWFKSRAGLDAPETPRDISFCGHTILGDDIFVIVDARNDIRFADNPLVTGAPHIRFYAGAPLRDLKGYKLGTLCLIDTEPRSLDASDLQDLRDLADMAQSELCAIQLATIDELTQVSNRRGFIAQAQGCLSLCARQRHPVSLVYLDLDHFKPINDRFGHAEGDRALVAFADLMRMSFRESDVCGRLGGDEFAVLLANSNQQHADVIVDRFRDLMLSYSREARRGYEIGFSDGIVSTRPDGDTRIDDLMAQADALMYEHKARQALPDDASGEG